MDLIPLTLRFVAGGVVVVAVTLLAKEHPLLAGILVFFPAVTIASLAFLGDLPPTSLREVVRGMFLGLVPLAAFIAGAYLGAERGVWWAIAGGLTAWLLVAGLVAHY